MVGLRVPKARPGTALAYAARCSECFARSLARAPTANLRTKILDFRGFDSSRISISMGGIHVSTGDIPKVLSQRILVGIILVGRVAVDREQGKAAAYSIATFD